MFVTLYQPTDQQIQLKQDGNETHLLGKWQVDTDEEGNVVTEEDLEIALNRVKDIRKKGGEACLAVIIE